MKNLTEISKYLSYILRHNPQSIGQPISKEGWLLISDIVASSKTQGRIITKEIILEIVKTSEKQRFAISEDGLFIRANQGHSISVDLNLKESKPPNILYHGTTERFLIKIKEQGLRKMNRHHVHLSESIEKALEVGKRRGNPTIITVKSGYMHNDGIKFFLSENHVWLTDYVSPVYMLW